MMITTWEDAEREEGLENLLREHRGAILDDFARDRLESYYNLNPKLQHPAQQALDQARLLAKSSPAASVVFSFISIELTVRDVIVFPLVYGFVHDEEMAEVIADLAATNVRRSMLFKMLLDRIDYAGLKTIVRPEAKKVLWDEKEDLQKLRDRIVHKGETAQPEDAHAALVIAEYFLNYVFPAVRIAASITKSHHKAQGEESDLT